MYYRPRIPETDDPQILKIFRKYFPLEKVSQKITDDVDVLVVLNDHKELIGFLSYELRKDTFFVFTLAFDSDYVGQGLASESFPLLVNYAKGLGCSKICGIAYKNTPALGIYMHWGFEIKKNFSNSVYLEKKI